MTHRIATERLRREAGRAHARLRAVTAQLDEARDQPPALGDLLTLPLDADPGVHEWAVLEVTESGSLLALPADTSPLVGSCDVAAVDGRVLRCGLRTRLPATVLSAARRSGRLDDDSLAAARHLCQVVERGEVSASLQALETDRDPEYRQLIGQLRASARAVAASPSIAVTDPAPTDPDRRAPAWIRPLAIAATLLFGLTLVVAIVQQRTIDQLRRSSGSPVVAPPVVWLDPIDSADRSAATPAEALALPAEAPYVVLLLRPKWTGRPPEVYRLQIATAGSEVELWSADLPPGKLPELFVLLPTEWLGPGEYHLRLSGQRGGDEIPAGRYRLRVAADPDR